MPNKSITITLVHFFAPLLLFLTPLFFLPITANFFGTPQQLLVIAITLVLLVGLTLDILFKRTLTLSTSPLRPLLIIFFGITITLLLVNPEGRTEALVGTGSLYLALSVFSYFLTLVPRTDRFKSSLLASIVASSTFLAAHSILQLTLLHSWTLLPSFMQNRGFTPTGSPLTTLTILILGSVVAFALARTHSSSLIKSLTIVSGTLCVIAAIAYASLMLPGGYLAPLLLPVSASWNIMLDSFKTPHNLIFGVGLANFSSLYTSVKPLFLNATPFWNILPSTATTEAFQWIITSGLLGAGAFLLLIATGFAHVKRAQSHLSPLALLFLGSTLALFLTPGSVPVYLLFFTSLALLTGGTSHESLPLQNGASYLAGLLLLLTIGYSTFYLTQFARAEYYTQQAKLALAKNDGKVVYESTLHAIQLVPTMTNYRLSYSQVNFSLAAALSQKSELTDDEKTNVNQLISQSIREGKVATSLRPHDVRVWQNLGNVYSNLLTVAQDSDQFALEAYGQAIAIDAGNPSLRIEFGNLLAKLALDIKDDTQKTTYLNRAVGEFQTAIQLKPDYALAYYHLAKLLESGQDYSNAYLSMQKAVSLLADSDPDLARVKEELSALKAQVPAPSSTPQPQNQAGSPQANDSLAPTP